MVVKEKSVGIALYHTPSKKVLLLHSIGNKGWVFPKGHLEAGEDDIQAVLRELDEETGLKYENCQELIKPLVTVKHSFMGREGRIEKEVVYYYLEIFGDLPFAKASDEAHDYLLWWEICDVDHIPFKYPQDIEVVRLLSKL